MVTCLVQNITVFVITQPWRYSKIIYDPMYNVNDKRAYNPIHIHTYFWHKLINSIIYERNALAQVIFKKLNM